MKLYKVRFKVWFNGVLSGRDYTVHIVEPDTATSASAASTVRRHFVDKELDIEISGAEAVTINVGVYPDIKKPVSYTKKAPPSIPEEIDLTTFPTNKEKEDAIEEDID